jgi:hypothetical protein
MIPPHINHGCQPASCIQSDKAPLLAPNLQENGNEGTPASGIGQRHQQADSACAVHSDFEHYLGSLLCRFLDFEERLLSTIIKITKYPTHGAAPSPIIINHGSLKSVTKISR